jgi:transposase
MTRLRGRARGGARCVDYAPNGHWMTTTLIGALRLDGTTACMTIDGATSGEVFHAYVKQVLAPTLRQGDIVILDNLSAHKNADAIRLIEEAGATVRPLPPYSPDFNPIEKMWSKIKEHLRDAKARTRQALDEAIAYALRTVTAQDAQGWFASCGYLTTQS